MDEVTLYFLFYLAALICLVAAAFQVNPTKVNLLPLGVAFAVLPLFIEAAQRL